MQGRGSPLLRPADRLQPGPKPDLSGRTRAVVPYERASGGVVTLCTGKLVWTLHEAVDTWLQACGVPELGRFERC